MVTYVFGTHKTGKSSLVVRYVSKIKAPVLLLAADPFQKDERTGKLVFPETWQRIDVDMLTDETKEQRKGHIIVIDDATKVRRQWKLFEALLAAPRQSAIDVYMTFHSFDVCPPQLFGYADRAICFRTATDVPSSSNWGLKKQMKEYRQYITEMGNMHSYYVVSIINGTITAVI